MQSRAGSDSLSKKTDKTETKEEGKTKSLDQHRPSVLGKKLK